MTVQNSALKIADIHCPECGAPARYDIRNGIYACQYCGGKVTVKQAQEEKQGFRTLQQRKLQNSAQQYKLIHASCSGCGAEAVFEENEALSNCAFCGRALVRQEYLYQKNLPEIVIPFQITGEEAEDILLKWCKEHPNKQESKQLTTHIHDLKGFYLPYEFVRGPVSCRVNRIEGGKAYSCNGFIDEVFVNCSGQLDNRLLDGMEPFDLSGLTEFDFAYVAGHRVKTDNISGKELEQRICQEVSESYAPAVRKVLETEAVEVSADVSSVVRMPALLPVYGLFEGNLMAAVNGQTGKVSVRALKESYFYFFPWWLKAILATIVISLGFFLGFTLFSVGSAERILLTGILAFFTLIVTLAAYSDTDRTEFRRKRERKIFTSGSRAYVRKDGALTETEMHERTVTPPVFFMKLNGRLEEVVLRFSTPLRFAGMILLAFLVLFLPVIIALFLNGFDFSRIELGGSAVWFCIFVPVIPIYLLKFGRIELYEHPWIYIVSEDGKKHRYHEPEEHDINVKKIAVTILKLLFVPPVCFAVWFAIASFCVMCYLTAFGF